MIDRRSILKTAAVAPFVLSLGGLQLFSQDKKCSGTIQNSIMLETLSSKISTLKSLIVVLEDGNHKELFRCQKVKCFLSLFGLTVEEIPIFIGLDLAAASSIKYASIFNGDNEFIARGEIIGDVEFVDCTDSTSL